VSDGANDGASEAASDSDEKIDLLSEPFQKQNLKNIEL
jgi:hypothetical protein